MLAMTTSPSEKNLAQSLVRQQRELEKEKRAKLQFMPDHHDRPTPLFNPPVKKEYNDETAARLKNLLGEPDTIACSTSRHTGRSQQDRRSLPQQPLSHPRDTNLPIKKSESPIPTAAASVTRLGDSGNVQAIAARPPAGHSSIGLADVKGLSSTVSSVPSAASSSWPTGQGSHPPLPGQAATFIFSSEIVAPPSQWHEPVPAAFDTVGGAALKAQCLAAATGSSSNIVQDGLSPAHGSVFQKPLPKVAINGLLNGVKPNIPKLVISDELVDHDVSSILQEMRSLTPLSGINTPRKEVSMLRFPVSGDTKGVVQAESSTMDVNRPSAKTSDNDVLAELITSDTDESDKSDAEESLSSSGHSTSDSDDDTSQSPDSDSDDSGNDRDDRGSAEPLVTRDRPSRPPEASHGAHSGDSWSLEALEQRSRSKVETPPLELPGLVCPSNRGKQVPSDRQIAWVLEECQPPILRGLHSPLPSSHVPNDIVDNAVSSADAVSAIESSICADIMADVSESSPCHDDVSEHGSVNHVSGDVFTDSHGPSKKVFSPAGSDDMDDENITVDIESVSPPSLEKNGPRHDSAASKTHMSCSVAGDPVSTSIRETQNTADLITAMQSQPNLCCPDAQDSQGYKECGDIGSAVEHEVSISTSTVTTTSEVELVTVGSPAHMQTSLQLTAKNGQPLRSPEHLWTSSLLASKNDHPFTVIPPEAKPASSQLVSKNDQPLTARSPETKRISQSVFKNDQSLPVASPEATRTTSLLVFKNDQAVTARSPETKLTSRLMSKNDQPLTAGSSEIKQNPRLALKNDQFSVMPMTDRSDETTDPMSLIVRIPLHLINKLRTQQVPPPKNAHAPSQSPAPSQSKSRSRYSSTSLSTSSDEEFKNITEHDEVVQSTAADAAAVAVKDKLDPPKNGGTIDGVSTDKAAQGGHSSKRKSVSEKDIGASCKKSRSSKKDDANVEAKSYNSTKESKKGPDKTVLSVPTPTPSDRSSDTGSASKKRRTVEQPAPASSEADMAHGSAKSGSNNSSSRHGDLPVRPSAPPLAPPSIPTKLAGPSYTNGLPPRASPSLISEIDSLPEYCRSPSVYLPEAKRLKHKADLCGDMLQKYLTYLDSIHMFLLCARAIERDSPANIAQIYKMYIETNRLLSHIHKHKHSKAVDTGVWAILSLWTQSLLCQKLYKLSRPDNEKHHKVVEQFFKEPINSIVGNAQSSMSSLGYVKNHGSPASPAPSPSGSVASTSSLTSDSGNGTSGKTGISCTPPRQPTSSTPGATNLLAPAIPGIVHVPIKTYTSMKGYAQTVRLLELCHQYWDQADMLVLEERHRAFFTHVEERVPPLTLHSSIIHLAHYLKVAVKSLRKMPEPASSAGRYS